MLNFILLILILDVLPGHAERAGITQCSSEKFPTGTLKTGGSLPGNGTSFLMQDKLFQFTCCGVLDQLAFDSSGGSLTLQIWRQTGQFSFELISTRAYTLSGSSHTPEDNDRVSFREGDFYGWSSNIIKMSGGSADLNWYTTTDQSSVTVGNTYTWYSSNNIRSNNDFNIQFTTQQSTKPFFKTLPAKLELADTETQIGGIVLLNLEFTDIDADDVTSGFDVTMAPGWDDLFELTTSFQIKTKERLDVATYEVIFRIEENHCGLTASSTLTVVVTDSEPSLTGWIGSATIHEDEADEKLLKTFTMSDPNNQPMWCKGDWTPGPEVGGTGTDVPFIVKMISTEAGSLEAGIYMIQSPKLEYDQNTFYNLTILCYDTYGHEVSGRYMVSIIENQTPIFANIGNMVEVDATQVITGTTIFTVSSNDRDSGDQITYTYGCSLSPCPFSLFDSGEVRVMENLWFSDDFLGILAITATDSHGNSNTNRELKIYVINRNNAPVLNNTGSVSLNIDENSALGTSLFQVSANDADSADTLTYFMSIDDPAGYDLFQLSSSGRLTTHSSKNINYDVLSTTSFTLDIHVHDGKEQASESITVAVNNVNEGPTFIQGQFLITNIEANVNDSLSDPEISASDPDAGDTLTYTMDCGVYSSYFTLDPTAATLIYAANYSLDNTALDLPQSLTCALVVHDSVLNNDTATLYMTILYEDDNDPVFNPATYNIDVRSDTPLGHRVLALTVTDADIGDNSSLTFTITQTNLSGLFFVVDNTGVIYAKKLLNDTKDFGTRYITVMTTDWNGKTAVATININFIDATTTPVVVDDRDRLFIEDFRNVWWVSLVIITVATCVFLVLCMITRVCRARNEPITTLKKLFRRPPKRKLDHRGRKMPLYGRQQQPQYRHVHANEILRNSPPPMVASPAAVTDNYSIRPDSVESGRVTVTDVRVESNRKKTPKSWMDGTETPAVTYAPMKSVTRPRIEDWDYINPRRANDLDLSPSQSPYYTPSEYVSSAASAGRRERRKTPKLTDDGHLTPAAPVPVSPSPVQFDNTNGDDFDDFRSERLSIASPITHTPDDPQ